MTVLLGLDIGTSATKAILIDGTGRVLATADARHEVSMPKPGWSEQAPDWWWNAVCEAIPRAIDAAGVAADEIKAVGLSGQMHGSVFLPADPDPRDPRPVRNAILWNDQRTEAECAEIEHAASGRRELIAMTGNPALTGFTAPKILWLRNHEPDHFDQTAKVILPKDYIRFRLSGELATDFGDGSGTLLLDLRARDWHKGLLSRLELDASLLPALVESAEPTGRVGQWAAEATGLAQGTIVVGGSGDQMTGAVGMGVVAPGIVSAALGTSGVIFAHAGGNLPEDPEGRVQIMCAAVPEEYCMYGCMLSAAGALQWFHDHFAPEAGFAQLDADAESVGVGADGLIFLPYLTGERCPHPDPRARGAFVGLTARHARAHLVRAVMEGVAFGMAGMLDLVRDLGVLPEEVRLGGGGAKSPLWRTIQAAAYHTPVATLSTAEGSAYGAALLAGVGCGVWSTVGEACRATLGVESHLEPDPEMVPRYARIREVYDALYPALRDSLHALSDLDDRA